MFVPATSLLDKTNILCTLYSQTTINGFFLSVLLPFSSVSCALMDALYPYKVEKTLLITHRKELLLIGSRRDASFSFPVTKWCVNLPFLIQTRSPYPYPDVKGRVWEEIFLPITNGEGTGNIHQL
jgi:hypothetical protein